MTLTASASGPDGDAITFQLDADGTITYTPPADFNTPTGGTDTITYTVQDDGTTDGQPDPQTATGIIVVTVTEVNDPPVTGPTSVTTDQDTPLTLSVVDLNVVPGPENESDQTLTIIAVETTTERGGAAAVNADGSITYTPPPGFNTPAGGTDTIVYTVQDDGTTAGQPDPQTATGTVVVAVAVRRPL